MTRFAYLFKSVVAQCYDCCTSVLASKLTWSITILTNRYSEIAFTPSVRQFQETMGSRRNYAELDTGVATNSELGAAEREFISLRDTFYMASTSETGWPYVQHRGGPTGFLKVIDNKTVGFADFRGNRQYMSAGNISADDRVSLILMDYPNRGHARIAAPDESELLASLAVPEYRARVERGIVINVAAFDWNCPQHITPRYTQAEVAHLVDKLRAKIAALELQLQRQA
jgi:uncharacterized protein